jgi:hypothetical protein
VATKESDKEIARLEADLASLSEADEALRILLLRARTRDDLEELQRVRTAVQRVWLRMIERRQQAGRRAEKKRDRSRSKDTSAGDA